MAERIRCRVTLGNTRFKVIFQTFSIKGLAIITFERERERGGGVGRANIF